MSTSADPHLEAFVRYMWSADTPPEPIYQTMALAAVRGDWQNFKPQWHSQRLPLGRVWVYPEFVAFLSASRLTPGQIPRGGQLALRMLEDYREMGLASKPLSIAREIHRSKADVRERLRKMLANPNSFLIPEGSVKRVDGCKLMSFRGYVQWFEVSMSDRDVVFAPPSTFGKEMVGAVASTFGARWEPRLIGHLRGMQERGAMP